MDPRDFGRLFIRRLPVMIAVGLLGLILALAFALVRHPMYEATSRVFVSTRTATGVQDLTSGSTFTQQIVKSYAEVATSPIVLTPVIQRLHLQESPQQLERRVTATASLDTVIIDVAVKDPNAIRAEHIADAVTQQMSTVVDSLTTVRANAAAVAITRIQPATITAGPVGPGAAVVGVLGLLVGLLVGAVAVLVWEALHRRVYSTRDATRAAGLPALAGLPRARRSAPPRPVVVGTPGADGYRALRANLLAAADGELRCVAVCSPDLGHGTTSTAANLAIAFAEGGKRVALVEADLRHPSLTGFLDLEPHAGLTDVLTEDLPVEDALVPWGDAGLQVLVAGEPPANASDLLQGDRMAKTMRQLADSFDLVIYDTSTVLESSDAAVIAARCSGTVLVCAAGRTPSRRLHDAVEALRTLGAEALGVVVTRLPRRGADAPSVLT